MGIYKVSISTGIGPNGYNEDIYVNSDSEIELKGYSNNSPFTLKGIIIEKISEDNLPKNLKIKLRN